MLDDRYFRVNNCVFPYFKHSHNDASNNERTIEIPLGEFFINNFGYGITEVGAVMGNYGFNCGEVINSLDNGIKNKNVLCISIASFSDKQEVNLQLLSLILADAKNYLITWPVGYSLILDNFVTHYKV